jgi:GNAT superfamily N-acetyltransferase
MEEFIVKQINSLFDIDLNHLVKESREEGFRFLERLVNEYESGTNTFDIDPFSNEESAGRLRRFYVSKDYRRHGLGRLLVNQLITDAKHFYKVLVLNTDTEQGDIFYTSLGFTKGNLYPNSTHYFCL